MAAASSSSHLTAEDLSAVSKGLLINGAWVAPKAGGTLAVINPATEEVLVNIPSGTAADVEDAVAAARAAFKTWGLTTGRDRAAWLRKIATAVAEAKPQLARVECVNSGKPKAEADWDMDDVSGCFNYYADLAEELDAKQDGERKLPSDDYRGTVRYEPMGVVAAIVPFNYPLLISTWKMAAALAAGCTVVLKPSENTPLSALVFGQLLINIGLPAGVLNIVNGTGPEVGEPLVRHRDVDKVGFTGSLPTGSRIMAQCAADVRNVTLELGGKSAALVFDDAELDNTVEWLMFGGFWTNGQICSATARILVHESVADELTSRLVAATSRLRVGDPMDPETQTGPVISKAQYTKLMANVKLAQEQGAKLLCGGKRPDHLTAGYFLAPTVFGGVTPDMSIFHTELFGPVVHITTFRTVEEAIELHNNCTYGLAAAIFTRDADLMRRLTTSLQVGIVWNNCSQPCFSQLPWGGFKKSGIGRDLGEFGLHSYMQPKQVVAYVDPSKPLGWYRKAKL